MHGGDALRHLELALSIYTLSLSIYLNSTIGITCMEVVEFIRGYEVVEIRLGNSIHRKRFVSGTVMESPRNVSIQWQSIAVPCIY